MIDDYDNEDIKLHALSSAIYTDTDNTVGLHLVKSSWQSMMSPRYL